METRRVRLTVVVLLLAINSEVLAVDVTTDPVVMIASYQVKVEDQESFLKILEQTEEVYRKHGVVTDRPIIRLRSMENPEYLVELIEWTSVSALGAVQENAEIQEYWSLLKSEWKRGDFGFEQVPESKIPWAVMEVIH